MITNAEPKPEKSFLSAAVESISPWTTSRSSTPKPAPTVMQGTLPKAQQGTDHNLALRHGLSVKRYPKDCPPLETRWFYAVDTPKRKPQLLKETPKDSKPLPPPKKFVSFSPNDSRSIETAYQKLVEDEEDIRDHCVGGEDQKLVGELYRNKENTSINEAGNLEQGGNVKVPVNEDYLFDVDVERRELAPVYWLGPIYEVRRGTWFYQDSSGMRPCEENLATQLEEGYLKLKPFRSSKATEKTNTGASSTKPEDNPMSTIIPKRNNLDSDDLTPKPSIDNLRDANKQSTENFTMNTKDGPQTHRLFGTYMNSIATYQDDTVAWLSSDGIMSRVSSTVYQRFAGGGYLGGEKLVRGYVDPSKATKATEAKSGRPVTPVEGTTQKSSNPGLQPDEKQQTLLKRRSAPPSTKTAPDNRQNEVLESKPSRAETREAALKRQISSMVIDTMDPAKGEEAARRREEEEIQTDYVDHDGEDQSREIEHLILVTHGIGQRLGMRTASVNFVHDCNLLRQTLKSVYLESADLQALNSEIDKLPKNCRIQVLPVCWRHLLVFPQPLKQSRKERDIGDTMGDEEIYPSLEDITLEGVPFVRSLITDLALDILLYQSAYREHITSIVLQECNRIYKLFMERNPYFRGKISLVGHSLGSAILFDLLCRQKEEKIHGPSKYHQARPSTRRNPKKDDKDLSFQFDVEDFYCLGSPVGLFQMLKGRTIAARHHPGAFPAESPMDPDAMDDPFLAASNPASFPSAGERISSTTGLPYTISSPKCTQLYNIFHPSDPIAYRLEPLIAPAMASLKPQALPYTKKGIFGGSAGQGLTGIGASLTSSVSGLWSSLSSGITSSLLNRSLGLTSEEVASMGTRQSLASSSPGAGTNISAGGVISEIQARETNEKMRQLAEDTAAADRKGSGANASILIDDEIETLYSGFQKRQERQEINEGKSQTDWMENEEKGKKLRREEMKVRGLNQSGRVDFCIQESVLDFNPINIVGSHLAYWSELDVSHFLMSQLLSRHRRHK